MQPRPGDRIVYTNDIPSGFEWVPYHPEPADLHAQIDLLCANGVDIYAQDVFHGVTLFKSEFCDTFGYVQENANWAECRFHHLLDRGIEPVDVWTAHCRTKDIKFVAGFRMNDRHSQGIDRRFMSRFLWKNTQWRLKEYMGGLDYSFPQVRDWLFNTMRECVQRFDVSGIELNYMRAPYVFPTNESRRKAPILTELMQRIRDMLDTEGNTRGRSLILGVWTPQSVGECLDLGMDVPTWVRAGIIDYVVPGDFGSNDMNMACDEFSQLTRDSACRLYPAIHPRPSRRHHPRTLLSQPAHRAAVRNFYALGADGFALFNYIYHWDAHNSLYGSGPMDRYPGALSRFAELRDPQELARQSRHYVFLPITDMGAEYPGIRIRNKLFMPFTREPWKPGRGSAYQQRAFRMAEDFSGDQAVVVRFRARGLMPEEKLEISYNGQPVPNESITRTHHPRGMGGGWDDGPAPQTLEKGYTVCEFSPPAPPEHGVEQVLGIELTESEEPTWHPDGSLNQIVVDEVEMVVAAPGDDPQDVFAQTREQLPPPTPVLAGYHPAPLAAWRSKCSIPNQIDADDGSLGETIAVAAMAQRFDLPDTAAVAMVDVLLQPQPAGVPDAATGTIRMSLCGDDGGRPGDALAGTTFAPLEHADELPCSLQGYYAFKLATPLELTPGTYWALLENADAQAPASFAYQPLFAARENCPKGMLMVRPVGADGWQPHPHNLFFGVHERGRTDSNRD